MAASFIPQKTEKKYHRLLSKVSRKAKASVRNILTRFRFITHSLGINTLVSQKEKVVLKKLFKFWEQRLNIHIGDISSANTNGLQVENDYKKLVGTLYETCFFDYHKIIEILKHKNSFSDAINRTMLDIIKITFQKLNISYEDFWYPNYKDLEDDKIGYFKNLHHFENRIQNLEMSEVERIYFKVFDKPCSPLGLPSSEWDTSKLVLKLDVVSNMVSNQNRFLCSLSKNLS